MWTDSRFLSPHSGQSARGDRRVPGELTDCHFFPESAQCPLPGSSEGCGGGIRKAVGDVLSLSAVAVWGCDEFAGNVVGDRCSEVFTHNVQAQFDAGCHPCRSQDGVVVDIEDVAVDAESRTLVSPFAAATSDLDGLSVTDGEFRGVPPVPSVRYMCMSLSGFSARLTHVTHDGAGRRGGKVRRRMSRTA
jgi:hypothetical protein